MKHLALAAACLALAACASAPPVVEGRFLQSGPADAPVSEMPLETRGTCEMILQSFTSRQRSISRCAARSARLAYGFDAKPPMLEPMIVSARTLEWCEKSREALQKFEAQGGQILSECRKL